MTIRTRYGTDAFSDRVSAFSDEVKHEVARTERLLAVGPTSDLEQDPAALREALAALRTQNEELLVAEEELRAQLEELHRMALTIKTERESYLDLFEGAPDAYIVTDRSGVIAEVNVAAVDLFQIDSRFLCGKPVFVLLRNGDESSALRQLISSLATDPEKKKMGSVARATVVRRSGETVSVVASIASASVRASRLLWILRVAADPNAEASSSRTPPEAETENETEREREESRNLRQQIREVEELLLSERNEREELERVSHAKDRFIAVLSHDLRAPLNAILGWTQLLRGQVLDANARARAIDTISRNARTQQKLIDELLDISRMAADQIELELTPVDVSLLLQRLVESTMPKAVELGLDLRIAVPDPRDERDLIVIADRQRLEQVFTNLLSNAMKFTPTSGRIDIELKRSDDRDRGEQYVDVIIRDTGKGIRPEVLPHIFDIYKQDRESSFENGPASSSSAASSGLGLGLYIVKRLVELQDGSVWAASEGEGQGATFTIRLAHRSERVSP